MAIWPVLTPAEYVIHQYLPKILFCSMSSSPSPLWAMLSVFLIDVEINPELLPLMTESIKWGQGIRKIICVCWQQCQDECKHYSEFWFHFLWIFTNIQFFMLRLIIMKLSSSSWDGDVHVACLTCGVSVPGSWYEILGHFSEISFTIAVLFRCVSFRPLGL